MQQIKDITFFTIFNKTRKNCLKIMSSERDDCRTFDQTVKLIRKKHRRSRPARLLWFYFLTLTRRCSISYLISLLSCHSVTIKRSSLSTQSGERVRKHFFRWSWDNCFQIKEFLCRETLAASWILHQCRRKVTNQLNDKRTATDKEKFKQDDLSKKVQIDKIELRDVSIWSKKRIIFELNNGVSNKI